NLSMRVLYVKFCLVVVVLLGLSTTSNAQQTVTGVVTGASGPLSGASVVVVGTSHGTQTDANGRYTIEATKEQKLRFSMIGYIAQELQVGNNTALMVTLVGDASEIGEVVVTALGIKRDKRSVGYATSTISGEDLTIAGVTQNPFLAMYGKAAGVGVNIGSGGPAAGVNIRIRGAAGLESGTNTRPLFVVDGVPLYDESTSMESRGYDPLNSFDYGSGINDLNADDIESIEILKGAKATVLYGSQALNGVVLITTKTGRG